MALLESPRCAVCALTPGEIEEYIEASEANDMTPDDFVIADEGTYNTYANVFYCTECYIKIGMPLGIAKDK